MGCRKLGPSRDARLLISVGLTIGPTSVATAQAPAPPPPGAPVAAPSAGAVAPPSTDPPTPRGDAAAAPLPAELMERFLKMEAANQKLLREVERLSNENRQLSNQVKKLNKKVGETSDEVSEKVEAVKPAEPEFSGIVAEGTGEEPSGEESSSRGAGARLLPYSQGVGNRMLGKIPLKGFLDYGRDGVGFATHDDEFLLKLRAELQADALDYLGPAQNPVHSGFYLPRVRYYFQGHYTKPIVYQLSFQRSYTTFGFLNVFLNFNYDPRFQFRVGRFKVPYAYEWYKLNNYRLITPERSLFNVNFGLNRQVGLMEWGEMFNQRMEYAVGIFDGPRNSFQDYNAKKDVAAFINFRPFGQTDSFLRNLNLGGSVDYGYQDNPLQPAVLRTNVNASSETLSGSDPINNATVPFLAFNNNVRERGLRELWSLHLAYYYKGLSLIAGWDSGIDSFAQSKKIPVKLPVEGYHVVAAYLITGETLNERTVVDPIHRFDLRQGKFGLGAFEPFARFSEINVGSQVFTGGLADPNLWTNRVQMVDVGMNWYLNRAVKIYFDWEHAMFATPVLYRPGALQSVNDLLWLRFQLYY